MGLLWPLKSLMTFFSPLRLSLILLAYLEEDEILMMFANFLTLQYFSFSCSAFYVVVFLWSLYFWYGIQWFQICFKNRIMWSQRKNELKHSQSTKQPQVGCGNGVFLRPNHPNYGVSVLNKWLSFCSLLVGLNKVCLVNTRKGTICFKILNKRRKITFKKLQQSLIDNKLKRNISFFGCWKRTEDFMKDVFSVFQIGKCCTNKDSESQPPHWVFTNARFLQENLESVFCTMKRIKLGVCRCFEGRWLHCF